MKRCALLAAMMLMVAAMLVACNNATGTESAAEPVDNSQAAAQPAGPSAAEQLLALDQWDLVWISDSTGWGAADIYAGYIEEDADVEVVVHDFAMPVLSAGEVLGALRREDGASYKVAQLADAVAEAEVVVFYANPIDSMSDEFPDDSNCMMGSLYVNSCPPESYDLYRQHLGQIYDQIVALRGNQPIIVHAYDSYQFPRRWAEGDVLEECQACWGAYTQAIHDAAAAHGIPIAHVYDAFTGPDHESDPRDTGLIGGDGQHTTEAGAELIASLVRDLGYEVTSP